MINPKKTRSQTDLGSGRQTLARRAVLFEIASFRRSLQREGVTSTAPASYPFRSERMHPSGNTGPRRHRAREAPEGRGNVTVHGRSGAERRSWPLAVLSASRSLERKAASRLDLWFAPSARCELQLRSGAHVLKYVLGFAETRGEGRFAARSIVRAFGALRVPRPVLAAPCQRPGLAL